MPMGISKVKMSREKLSQKSRNIAPIIAELANTARLSAPKIKRAMCGTISPIQPMIPAIVTLSALTKVATRMMKILTRAVFTPRLFASSSPRLSAFRYLPLSASSKMPAHIGRIEIWMKLLDAKPRLPIKKYLIAGSAPLGSAAYFSTESSEVKSEPLMTPPNTSTMTLPLREYGAEPGIAAIFKDDINDTKELINFGKNAKNILLTTKQAFDIAMAQNVFLKELKGGTRGVIGALAGIGFRLNGDDGKIRGKFKLNEPKLSVAKLTELPFIEAVLDENFKELAKDEMINLDGTLKPIFLHHKATLPVQKDKNGEFRNLNIKELREF